MESIDLPANLTITMTFSEDDLAWIRQEKIAVPAFWKDHLLQPQIGDILRFAGFQFVIGARAWEHDGKWPVLRLYLSSRQPEGKPVLH